MFMGVGHVGRQLLAGNAAGGIVASASLNLNFMQPGTLDPRVTFTRASGGTYFNSAGVMQTTAMNLCLYSGDMSNAVWVPQGVAGSAAPTVTANQTTAPDGTTTAARIVFPAVTNVGDASILYQAISLLVATTYAFSIYLKGSVGGEQLDLVCGGDQRVTLTTQWQRFILITPSLPTGVNYFEFGGDRRFGGAATLAQTIYAWGGQVELGSTASPYIPTTTAPNGAPRWDYNPSTHALNGLLIEEARTNIWLQSGDASNVQWAAGSITSPPPSRVANAAIAPDGTLTACQLTYPVVSIAGSSSSLQQSPTMTAAIYTFSVWLKGSVGGEQIYLCTTPDAVTYCRTLCPLTTAWQRFTLTTGTLTAAQWFTQVGVDLRDASQTSKPTQTVYVWGAQMEQGAFPTSYIPTTAAAVTRAYDSCYIASANTSPWFAPPGGSWMAEFIDNVPVGVTGTSPRIIGIHDASAITPLWEGTPVSNLNEYDGAQVSALNAITMGAISKGASVYASGVGAVCLNGGAIGSGSMLAGFGPLATSGVGIMGGNPGTVNETMTGYIRRVRYWPRVLTNAELQSVTT